MAEQNILNGDQQVLEQILGDINEHAEKKERLERMSVSIRDITKEIDLSLIHISEPTRP